MSVRPELVALFTDFGVGSHYTAQVQARLFELQVKQPVLALCSDAPAFSPMPAAYLLASFYASLPKRSLVIAVVDPGVGSDRRALLVETERHIYLAPDNGLLSQVIRHSESVTASVVTMKPQGQSTTFDGRDLFAPAAAILCNESVLDTEKVNLETLVGHDWPSSLDQVIYIDRYGNLATGINPKSLDKDSRLLINGWSLSHARTFSEVPEGDAFWYINANGLVEVSLNRGDAARAMEAKVGTMLQVATH